MNWKIGDEDRGQPELRDLFVGKIGKIGDSLKCAIYLLRKCKITQVRLSPFGRPLLVLINMDAWMNSTFGKYTGMVKGEIAAAGAFVASKVAHACNSVR
jgi:hypothetical protein